MELRLELTLGSRSTLLRFGEECDEWIPSARFSRLGRRCSIVEEVGTDEEMAFPLELRERLLFNEECICFGLLRAFPEPVNGLFPVIEGDLEGLELPLFLRSIDGIVVVLIVMAGRPPGVGLALRPRLSRAAFISGGIGTWCTILTDLQSAAWIRRCSCTVGGLQQPGQPINPACFGGGLRRAHWT